MSSTNKNTTGTTNTNNKTVTTTTNKGKKNNKEKNHSIQTQQLEEQIEGMLIRKKKLPKLYSLEKFLWKIFQELMFHNN